MEIRQPRVPPELIRALEKAARFLKYCSPETIYYCVEADYRHVLVGVFGNGAWGQYEWFIWDEDNCMLRTSDNGHGCIGLALCCGLVEANVSRPAGDHDELLTWRRER